MTVQEFSDEFDVLLNSYNDIKPFGETDSVTTVQCDEYEKSVLLTEAQETLLKQYFQAFDKSELVQADFSGLIQVSALNVTPSVAGNSDFLGSTSPYASSCHGYVELGNLKWLCMLNEIVVATDSSNRIENLVVISLNYRELDRLRTKPYKYPVKSEAWRFFSHTGSSDNAFVELLIPSNKSFNSNGAGAYKIRFVRYPRPIILVDLNPSGLQIGGLTDVTEAESPERLHKEILRLAVQMAFQRKGINIGQARDAASKQKE